MSSTKKLEIVDAIRQQKAFILAFKHVVENYDEKREAILEDIRKLESDLVFLDNAKDGAPAAIRRHEDALRRLQASNVAAGTLRLTTPDHSAKGRLDRKIAQLRKLANDPEVGPMIRQMLAKGD